MNWSGARRGKRSDHVMCRCIAALSMKWPSVSTHLQLRRPHVWQHQALYGRSLRAAQASTAWHELHRAKWAVIRNDCIRISRQNNHAEVGPESFEMLSNGLATHFR